MCKVLVLMSPFAFISLISNQFDGLFKGWLKEFCTLLCVQILVSIILVVGFSLDLASSTIIAKFTYFAIILTIAKCQYNTKNTFLFIYEYSNNTLKNFI